MTDWISVDDKLPTSDGLYIVHVNDEGAPLDEGVWCSDMVTCAEFHKGDWVWNNEYYIEEFVTHWQPLPEFSKEMIEKWIIQ